MPLRPLSSPSLLLSLIAATAPLRASPQSPAPAAGEPSALAASDPYTLGAAKAMQAAGVLAYGPFPWADGLRTDDVDKVLGENRIRWIETAHFLIGSTLGSAPAPDDAEARKLTAADLARMRKRHAKFPERASRIDPWLRLHLYAHRAEELYGEIARLTGHDDTTGTHLGQRGKIPILLLQKKSDVARYHDRFCGMQSQMSQRSWYGKSQQHGFVLCAEGDDPYDEATVHAHFRFFAVQTLADAAGGLPYWLSLGLAHWYERQVPCNTMMATVKADEAIDQDSQNKWGLKMKKRAQHEQLLIPFAELATKTDFGYWAHLQVWSRVDFLMQRDRGKLGAFVAGVRGGSSSVQIEQLEHALGLTPEAFDAAWRAWLLAGAK